MLAVDLSGAYPLAEGAASRSRVPCGGVRDALERGHQGLGHAPDRAFVRADDGILDAGLAPGKVLMKLAAAGTVATTATATVPAVLAERRSGME